MEQHTTYTTIGIFILIAIITSQGFILFQTYRKTQTINTSLAALQTSHENFKAGTVELNDQQNQKLLELSDMLYETQNQLSETRNVFSEYMQEVGELSGTVETLEKISTTDPELLQKYSKVYFLNEHYTPSSLEKIEDQYIWDGKDAITIHSKVYSFLKDLLNEARQDDVDLVVLSGYRSFDEQQTLKGQYTIQYGSGANTFSADQGYSEHQLGTTVDFTTVHNGADLDSFGETRAFSWLQKNAYKFGFVLSYPENNEYYQYEPWHWRFVGIELATDLHSDDEYFYDLEQREIDSYIPLLFED